MNMKLISLPALGLTLAAGSLLAQGNTVPGTPLQPGPAWGQREPGQIPPALLERFDLNGDGQLDESERAALREEMANRPGAARMREEILKRFDKNGDGQLDEAERAEFQKFREARMREGGGPGGPGGPRMREELRKRADKNGDGQIDESERAAAREAMKKRRAERAPGT
jgi:hypothetical protein